MPRTGIVITAFDQGAMVQEAVDSALAQTLRPDRVVVVDDGSADPGSLEVLETLAASPAGVGRPPVEVIHQPNLGVSAARNRGLAACGDCAFVTVLDGDDRLAPEFLRRTVHALVADPTAVGASSSMRMFGVAHAVVMPAGGDVSAFLARNACPATLTLRREAWARTGGYAEDMRSGFEDWDFFLTVLSGGGRLAVLPEPLIEYRTAPDSANIVSMDHRAELVASLMDRHPDLYTAEVRARVTAQDAAATARLRDWERAALAGPAIPLDEASFGDGGMAAVVRVASARAGSHEGAPLPD